MPKFPVGDAFVLVDHEDIPTLSRHQWFLTNGYAETNIDGVRVKMHRWLLELEDPHVLCDHRNLDTLDNRRRNIRPATKAQNGMNRTKRKDNTSGFKGVYLCKQTQRWRAEIHANRSCYKLGRFDTPVKAALAYDRAAIRLHGDFARTNFPRENYAIKKDQ